MADQDTRLSLKDCAKRFNRSEEEIKKVLEVHLGLMKNVKAASARIDADKILKLDQYFSRQEKQAKGKGSAVGGGTRKVNAIEVSEKKVRERGQRPRLSLAALAAKKQQQAGAAAAETAAPAKEEKPPRSIVVSRPVPRADEADGAEAADGATGQEAEAEAPAAELAADEKEEPAAAEKPARKRAKTTAAKKSAAKKPAAKKAATEKPAAEKPAKKRKRPSKKDKEADKAAQTPPVEETAEVVPVAEAVETAPVAEAAEAAPAAEAAETAPVVEEAVPPVADRPASAIEKLLAEQGRHQEQKKLKDKQIQEEAARKKQAKAAAEQQRKQAQPGAAAATTGDSKKPAAAAGKKKKKETLKLDRKALDKHRKKQKKSITRTEAREKTAENLHTFVRPTAPIVREVQIPDAISVNKLAGELALKSSVVIRALMDHGLTVTANELLDKETAWIIVEELGHTPVNAPDDDMEKGLLSGDDAGSDSRPRPPVVTVMGHVDHGKTSLLDYIRKTRVASGEAGGITQHIGAYRVDTKIGAVTFLDTPGHELFSQMRARGAKVTDIVVLVVAADDGVKPQTIEAINHAKAAGVTIIVAANKMDKPEANLDRLKRELAEQDLLPEDWGGDTMVVPISAATGDGVEDLLDTLAIQTELLELKAPWDVPAAGAVIEARVDKGRGIVATLVITRGVLRRGQAFLCGTQSGVVRTMWNISNPKLEEVSPSMPVEIQGLSGTPEAGAEFLVVESERTAREIAKARQERSRLQKMVPRQLPGTDLNKAALLLDAVAGDKEWKDLNVVIRADVEGSREALSAALSGISGKHAGVKVLHSAVGTVTESDIYLAQTSGGVVVAFNVRPDSRARKLAESRGVKILVGNVVYELVEKVREAVLGLLAPIIEEKIIATAVVQEVFGISGVGNIAGCLVKEGVVRSKSPLRLLRDQVMVYEGAMASLYHFKDAVAEVRAGSECGIGISRYNDIKVGDVIEVLERTETAPEM